MVFYLNTFKSHGSSVRLNLKGGTVFTRSRIGGFETMRQSRQRHPRQVGRSSKMYLALSLCLFSANLDHNNPLRPPQERNRSRCRHRGALLQRGVQPTLHGAWRRLPHDRLPCQWHGGEIPTLSRRNLKLRLHDDQLSLVAREMAPSASNRDMYSKGRSSKNGPAASGVPGKGKGLKPRVPSFANSIQLLKKIY